MPTAFRTLYQEPGTKSKYVLMIPQVQRVLRFIETESRMAVARD